MENTFTTFILLLVTQVLKVKFTTFIFTHMMVKELNSYQDSELKVFMDKISWNTDKNTSTS